MNTDNKDWAKRAQDAGVDGEFIMPEEQAHTLQAETDAYAAFSGGDYSYWMWVPVAVIIGAVVIGAVYG